MPEFTISQVARRTGIQPSALRYYESVGLLPSPQRHNGRRYYNEGVLHDLALIQTAQQAGFSLEEARILLNEILPSTSPKDSWQDLIQRKLRDVNTLMLHAQRMKALLEDVMNCDTAQLAECIYITGQKHKRTTEVTQGVSSVRSRTDA
ncbi:MAG TPA: MerR family transcriptional regulator [Aggregatilineales bacterium]|nr:MerR family transcriptional regulator [Aggregatilineales bacterium]